MQFINALHARLSVNKACRLTSRVGLALFKEPLRRPCLTRHFTAPQYIRNEIILSARILCLFPALGRKSMAQTKRRELPATGSR